MSAVLAPFVKFRGFDNNGNELSGGKLFTYAAGTTTKQASYIDTTGNTPNTNPIILNSRGECDLYFNPSLLYKLVLAPANDTDPPTNPFWTEDQQVGIAGSTLYSDTGSGLIGYNNGSTGAVTQSVQNKLTQFVNVADYGAVGDGVTDNATFIQDALNYLTSIGGGVLWFPYGTFCSSAQFTVTVPIFLWGQGAGWYDYTDFPATVGTTIKFIGSGGTTCMVLFQSINNGYAGVRGINFNGNNLANAGVLLDGCTGMLFEGMSIIAPINVGLRLFSSTVNTCSWNTFINTTIETLSGGKAALWLSGSSGVGNASHNTFVTTRINFGGSQQGLYLGGCDNNTFHMTFIFASGSPTGYGVYVDPSEQTGFPGNNTFFHLEPSTRGWYQPSGTVGSPARIYYYGQDNGEPLPNLNVAAGELLPIDNVIYPLTVAAGSGWSGGTPTFSAQYTYTGRTLIVDIVVTGTAVVAAANATITGLPVIGSTVGILTGNNQTAPEAIFGQVVSSTLFINSGLTSFSTANLKVTYTI